LWEGRFKSCLVDSEQYLLRCYRYIELNPVRARMVEAPGSYPWSSYAVNAERHADRLVTPPAAWLALDADPASRGARYAAWVSEGVDAVETEEIRVHLMQGSQRFRRHIEALAGRCTEVRPRGRPCLIQREIEPGTF
jgi:putative transposase